MPRSVTNVDDMINWPMRVADRPVSTSTAYTTAREVVDRAMPPISAARQSQPAAYRQASRANANGARNDSVPISRLAFQLLRSATGSTSAPARTVSTTDPKLAKNTSQSGMARCRVLPTTMPARISMTATDRPSSTENILATNAVMASTAATVSGVPMSPLLEADRQPGKPGAISPGRAVRIDTCDPGGVHRRHHPVST